METLIKKINKMELHEFIEQYEYEINEIINKGGHDNTDIEDLFNNEDNWNNADITSGDYVLSEDEIEHFLECAIETLAEEENRCSNCARVLHDVDDYKTESQSHPYGETSATETLVCGYRCGKCGYEEQF